jgi:hypothetical protein
LLHGIFKWVEHTIACDDVVTSEGALLHSTLSVSEFTATLHHSFLKLAFVFVTLHPLERTLTIVELTLELTFVRGTISIHGVALSLSLIHAPVSFIFGQNTIIVALTVIDLETVAMSNFLVIYLEIGSWKRCNFSFLFFGYKLLGAAVKVLDIAIVDGSVGFRAEAFKFRGVNHFKIVFVI